VLSPPAYLSSGPPGFWSEASDRLAAINGRKSPMPLTERRGKRRFWSNHSAPSFTQFSLSRGEDQRKARIGHHSLGAHPSRSFSQRAIREYGASPQGIFCRARKTVRGTSPALPRGVQPSGNGEARQCTCNNPNQYEQTRLGFPTGTKALRAASLESHRRLALERERTEPSLKLSASLLWFSIPSVRTPSSLNRVPSHSKGTNFDCLQWL